MNFVSTDRRAVRTRKAIQSHFLDLLLRKKFNEITVKDIVSAANVGRGTFYLHYEDKFDLLEKVTEEGLAATIDRFHPKSFIKGGTVEPELLIDFVSGMFDHFQKNERFFRAMFFNEGLPSFGVRMQQGFLRKFYSEIHGLPPEMRPTDPITMEILPVFVSSGMIGLVGWWLRNEMRISKEDVANRVLQIMTRGPLQTLGFRVDRQP